MNVAHFHNGSHPDKTGKYSHAVVAWNNAENRFATIYKVLNESQALEYFEKLSAEYGDYDGLFTLGIYPFVPSN